MLSLDDTQQMRLLNAVMDAKVRAKNRADKCVDPAQEEYFRHEQDELAMLWLMLCGADQIQLQPFPEPV